MANIDFLNLQIKRQPQAGKRVARKHVTSNAILPA